MNNRGNLMLNILFFLMGLGVMILFISPISQLIGVAQSRDGLNCVGYFNPADPTQNYTSAYPTNTIACMAFDWYLPYIVLVFLVAGVAKLLYDRVGNTDQTQPDFGGI